MTTEFTKKEKEFFKRYKSNDSKIRTILITITAFIFAGVLIDALNGFWVIKEAKSFAWGVGGICLLSIFCLVGEAGVEWITGKDKVSNPLYKRISHLVLLLSFLGLLAIVMVSLFKQFKQFGW